MEKAIEQPVEGKRELSLFLMNRTAAIPDDVRETLQRLALEEPSPVVACVEASELIYARADELPPELIELGAQLAAMNANYNFHGMRNEGRGYAMAMTLRKRPGVKPEMPAPSEVEAPAPSNRHRPPQAASPDLPDPAQAGRNDPPAANQGGGR